MKRALSLLFITSLLIIGIAGFASAVSPSGPGQTTAAHSVSVVMASDAPSISIAGGGQWATVFSTALDSKLIVKTTSGRVRSLYGRVDATAATATYYLQGWNLTDVPTDATTVTSGNSFMAPVKISHVNGFDDQISIDFTSSGFVTSTGIVFGLSTTEFTKTAAGSYLSLSTGYL